MNIKRLLLTGCLIGAGLGTATAIAQDVKPGQRMIYDNRVTDQPSQLDRPIFNRRIIVPQQTPAEQAGEASDEAATAPPDSEDTTQQGRTDAEPPSSDGDGEPSPLFVAPQPDASRQPGDESQANEAGQIDLESIPPRKLRKLEKMLDDLARRSPHKNLTQEKIDSLSLEEKKRALDDLRDYNEKSTAHVKKELME